MILAASFLSAQPLAADALQFDTQAAAATENQTGNSFLAIFRQLAAEASPALPVPEEGAIAAAPVAMLPGKAPVAQDPAPVHSILPVIQTDGLLAADASPEAVAAPKAVPAAPLNEEQPAGDAQAAQREMEMIAYQAGVLQRPMPPLARKTEESPAKTENSSEPINAETLATLQKEIRDAKIPGVKIKLERSRSAAAFSIELPVGNAGEGMHGIETVNKKTEELLGQEFMPGKHKQTFSFRSKNISSQAPASKTLQLEMEPATMEMQPEELVRAGQALVSEAGPVYGMEGKPATVETAPFAPEADLSYGSDRKVLRAEMNLSAPETGMTSGQTGSIQMNLSAPEAGMTFSQSGTVQQNAGTGVNLPVSADIQSRSDATAHAQIMEKQPVPEAPKFASIQEIIQKAAESKSPIQSIVLKYKIAHTTVVKEAAQLIEDLAAPVSLAKRLFSSDKGKSLAELPDTKAAAPAPNAMPEAPDAATHETSFLHELNVPILPGEEPGEQPETKKIVENSRTLSDRPMIRLKEDYSVHMPLDKFTVQAEKAFPGKKFPAASAAEASAAFLSDERFTQVFADINSDEVRTAKPESDRPVQADGRPFITVNSEGKDSPFHNEGERASDGNQASAKESMRPARESAPAAKEKFEMKDFVQFSPATAQKANIEQKPEFEAPRPTLRIHIENFSNGAATLIRALPEEAAGMARIVLTPDALGRVEVNVNLQQNSGIIRLEVDSLVTKHALEAQIPALQEKLSQHGIQVDKVEVQLRNEQDANLSGGYQQQQNRSREEGEERQNFVRSFKHLNEIAQKSGKQIDYQQFIRQYA